MVPLFKEINSCHICQMVYMTSDHYMKRRYAKRVTFAENIADCNTCMILISHFHQMHFSHRPLKPRFFSSSPNRFTPPAIVRIPLSRRSGVRNHSRTQVTVREPAKRNEKKKKHCDDYRYIQVDVKPS